MSEFLQNCTREDFLALLMEYASNADMGMTDEAMDYIIKKVGHEAYKKADAHYKEHTDFEVLQDIIKLQSKFFPGENGRSELHIYLMEFFYFDGEFTTMELVFDQMLERLFVS
ncbi:MAG: hypothetical protein HKN92_11900 [Chitinophagales bacterium]|nr:hypothetical protein [Chitinophagales bacterium]